LRNQELKQAGIKRKQVWRGLEEKSKEKGSALEEPRIKEGGDQEETSMAPKDRLDGSGRSAPACMVYFLPNEFMAPANQVVQEEVSPDVNEDEQLGGLMAQLVLAKQATFDKPAGN
jgi:hypothetical protein